MKVQRLIFEDPLSNNKNKSAQYFVNTKLEKDLFHRIFIDYFENRIHPKILSKKYGICFKIIKYEMYKTGFTLASYLEAKYSKEYLEGELLNMTFKQLADNLKLSLGELRTLLRKKEIKRDTSVFYLKNKVNQEFFTDVKFQKEFFYFLGLFVTDGYIVNKNLCRIVIKNEGSKELLESIAKVAGHSNVRELKQGFYSLSFKSKELIDKLLEVGVPFERKTYNLKKIQIPNKECLYSFLAGALDGDGHIDFNKSPFGYRNSLGYCLGNYCFDFLDNLKNDIKNQIGFDFKIRKDGNFYTLTLGTRSGSKEFFENMYKVTPFKLESKYILYCKIVNKVMI